MSAHELRAFYETVARYYDAENAFKTDDLVFYSDLVADLLDGQEGPALDVGSGTGRVLLHLAQAGLRVTGFEVSRRCWPAPGASWTSCPTCVTGSP